MLLCPSLSSVLFFSFFFFKVQMPSLLGCRVLPATSERGILLSKASWWNAMTAGFRVDFNSNIPVSLWKSLLSLCFHCWNDKEESHSVWNSSYFILLCFLRRSLPSLFWLSSHIFYLVIFPIVFFIWVRIFFFSFLKAKKFLFKSLQTDHRSIRKKT